MEFIKPGTIIDFMRYRRGVISVSLVLLLASLFSLYSPGPNYGIDFAGGTEIQLRFPQAISASELRKTLENLGYERPDVVSVQGTSNEYMLRVREVSALPKAEVEQAKKSLARELESQGLSLKRFKPSPGGDKVAMRLSGPVEPSTLEETLRQADLRVRSVYVFGDAGDHRYEAQLLGVADEVVRKLRQRLGSRAPEDPRRVEWVGPKAGSQLRDSAIKALLYALGFIMVYVTLRFDLRFAPGGVLAMIHDAVLTVGMFVLLQKQFNLTTIAALLTILGYSINDTIVVYDRLRENMSRYRDKSLRALINISTSQMLSRTIVTSGTTLLSVSAFFVWGTEVIRDLAFALMVGIAVGTYSSVYIAAPVTEWMDTRFFQKNRA